MTRTVHKHRKVVKRGGFSGKKFLLISLILLCITVVGLKLLDKQVQASWSPIHGNWLKRKQLSIVNSSTVTLHTNTPIAVSIDTKELFDQRKIKSDCSDLRILYQPSDTVYTELPRYLVFPGGSTCSTSTATKVYFSLQSDMSSSATSTLYYLYYNNPQATVPTNSDNAFDMGDKEALLVCPFSGSTTCAAGETPTTATGAIRYSGGASALSFDGVNDKVDVSTSAMDRTTAITFESWFKTNATSSSYEIISLYQSFELRIASGVVSGYMNNGTSEITLTGTTNIQTDTWYHAAIVYDNSSSVKLFVNGTQEDSDTLTGDVRDPGVSTIGVGWYGGGSGRYFNGLIDEVRISNIARYSSNFVPRTSPFIRDEYTKLLLHFDENGDDPRNTGKAIDDSGNGNHGTITGAKYVSGMIGIDSGSTSGMTGSSGAKQSQSFASHEGVFIEEGTTNKITNPSFEHDTFNTTWTGETTATTFNLATASTAFTPSMAKRNSAGPFAAGVMVQGKYDSTYPDLISWSKGSQIGPDLHGFLSTFDTGQGSIVFWITPEWDGNDGKKHVLFKQHSTAVGVLYKGTDNYLYYDHGWSEFVKVDVSSWTAGTTYNVVVRWDRRNKLDGTNYMSISVNDLHTFMETSLSAYVYNQNLTYVGSDGDSYPANAIIEGLTIYRRPLFDGTYGINVGNGDEINQIWGGAIASSKDPTLVTGSWDVVFALPTNAVTGSLATGTGNAWSHPHSSNLLYTSTTNTGGFMMNGTYTSDGWSMEGSPTTVAALATTEKIYAGGYKTTSDAADEGIYASFASTSGQDFVVRAVGHSDGTCAPRVLITRADGTTEVTHLDGTTTSTRTAPNNYIFTFESPAAENLQVQLINTATTGTCYWHQVEVLGNLIDNPSMERVTGTPDPWIPDGWTNNGFVSGETTITTGRTGTNAWSMTKTSGAHTPDIRQNPNDSIGNYYALDFWRKRDTLSRVTSAYASGLTKQYLTPRADGLWDSLTSNSSTWSRFSAVLRADNTNAPITFGSYLNTGTLDVDDVALYLLTPVSLTVTPASLANSTETSGIRVDGQDNLTQTISGLTATAGAIKFKITPRHNIADSLKFGYSASNTPRIAEFYGDANNRFYIYSNTHLHVVGYLSGSAVDFHVLSPTFQAGTTYDLELSYDTANNLVLKVNGVTWITGSIAGRTLATVPTTAYFGSAQTGLNQYDATFNNPGNITLTENTTAPYVKFGTKSVKLVESNNVASPYTTAVNAGNTATHTLSAYVYDGTTGNIGGTVSSTIAKLVFNGATVTPTYTDTGGGWWRLSYSGAVSNSSTNYGVEVQAGKTIYLDGLQLEEKAYATTYADGSLGTGLPAVAGYAWTGTANESTSTRMRGDIYVATTNNIQASSGSISLWFKPQIIYNSAVYKGLFNAGGNNMIDAFYIPAYNGYIRFGNNNNLSCSLASLYPTNGEWIHVVATWSGTSRIIYCNNSATSYNDVTAPTIGDTLKIGQTSMSQNDYAANANIADFRVYDSVVSSTEVSDLYHSGLASRQETNQTYVVDQFGEEGQDPIATWHFDEGYGTTAHDSTLNANNGTITGATWQEGSMCVLGKCLKFDGNDSVTSSPIPSLTTNFTYSSWFKWQGATGGYRMIYQSGTSTNNWNISLNTVDQLTFTENGLVNYPSTVSVSQNVWHHLAVVKNGDSGGNITFYLDGTLAGTASVGTVDTPTGTAYTGSASASGFFNGFLDEVKIYPYARTAAQVKVDYAEGAAQIGDQTPDPLSDGLVGYWKLDESYSPAIDSSGNANSGTWSGNTAASSGKYGNAASFATGSDYITINDSDTLDMDADDNITLSAWVKPNSVSGIGTILTKGTYWLHHLSTGILRISLTDGVDTAGPQYPGISADGNWHHVVTTINRNETIKIRMYVDGVEKTCNGNCGYIYMTGVDSLETSNNLTINRTSYPLNGSVDEVRIYKRALSSSEVSKLYEYAPAPVAHWKLDEGAGISAFDSSGNGNTGTLTNGPTWTNGKYGKAVKFDGSNDYVNVSSLNNSIPAGGNFTLSWWLKPTSSMNQKNFIGANGSWNAFLFNSYSNGSAYVGCNVTDRMTDIPAGTIVADTWQNLVFIYNNGMTYFYKDGQLIKSKASAGPVAWTSFRIGTNDAWTVSGNVDDVRIYNYARTQKQIVQDMLADHPAVTAAGGSISKGKPAAPVAYYKFDEGADNTCLGGVNDVCNAGSGGASLDGTVTGATRTNSGKFGKALSFDGSDDYASVADNAALNFNDSSFSFGGWFNANSLIGSYIMAKYTASATYQLGVGQTANKLTMYLRDSAGDNTGYIASTTSLSTNTWYHALVTVDQVTETASLYLNGKKENTASLTNIENISPNSNLMIGTQTTSSGNFKGKIDEMKIYPYALSADEVKLEYNRGSAMVLGDQAPQDSSSVPAKLSNGLVGWWKLDETASPALDSSGNNNSGTWVGNTTYAAGKFSNAASFDGTGDAITVSANSTFNSSSFSVGGWFNPANQNTLGFLSKNSYLSSWRLYMQSGTLGKIRFDSTGGNNLFSSITSLSANQWAHVFVTYDTAQVKMYINGKFESSISASNVGNSYNGNLIIGDLSSPSSSAPYNGKIDDIRFYNRALSSQEVEDLYNYTPPPIAHWSLDEGTGITAFDKSGNGNNGTLTNGPVWSNGKIGKAVKMDATDDYVTIADSPSLDITGALTIQTWAKKTDTTATTRHLLSKAYRISDVQGGFSLWNDGANNIRCTIGANTADVTGPQVSDTRWRHYTCVYIPGTSVTLYVDGKYYTADTTDVSASLSTNDYPVRIGSNSFGAERWAGFFDDAKIYNYALTPAQIAWEYSKGEPIGWWKLDECTGTVAHDSSGNQNDGTITIGATGTQDQAGSCATGDTGDAWYNGKVGKINSSLSFDGSDDYINLGSGTGLNPTNSFAISMWIKPSNLTQSQKYLMGKNNYYGLLWEYVDNSVEFFGSHYTGANPRTGSQMIIPDTNWHHIIYAYDGTTFSGYLDGQKQLSVTTTFSLGITGSDLYLGASGPGANTFAGLIDDARIYNYALSPSQVKTLYTGGAVIFGN